jgi:SAM-dependent methyltransferase
LRFFPRLRSSQSPALAKEGYGQLPILTETVQDSPIRDARTPLTAQSPGDVKRYYEEKTAAYLEGFGEVFQGSRPASTSELLDYIIDAAGLTDGSRILDAGCGVCGPSIYFAQKRQLAIEAVTISPKQVREAQKRIDALHLNGRITVREGDFHRLAQIYEPDSFDRVLFLETICHARDYRTVIEQAMRLLKPGGLLYIKDFYCQDFSSKPDLIETQLEDLRALNRVYCLVLPDLVSLLGLVSELGLMLEYLRKPGYNAVFEPWINFDRVAGVAWTPKLPYFELIAGMELCCRKPMRPA